MTKQTKHTEVAEKVFDAIEDALADIVAGKMVIVVDDENRENEGDLVMAAEKVTPEAINFMARHGRGLICLPMTEARLAELEIPPMVGGGDRQGTAFMVSIDAREGTTTGISAADRARTILAAIDPRTRPEDLARPGHVFPLAAREGGVLRRPGHTEAAVDLARMAGLYPAGVICEIMNEDGTMARLPELRVFARAHGLRLISIADLIRHRRRREKLVRRAVEVRLPTRYGEFTLVAYDDVLTGDTHVALVAGDMAGEAAGGATGEAAGGGAARGVSGHGGDTDEAGRDAVLVRVHSECLTGDLFGSLRCDCGDQLARALEMIQSAGRGVLLYMRQEGRGIGLRNKLKAYALQDEGLDTVEANEALGFPPDARDYGTGAQILADLGVRRIRLLTNNPRKYHGLAGYGLEIVERIPLAMAPNPVNARYLEAKRTKLGHLY